MQTNSIWEHYQYPRNFPSLNENIKTDCLIIGAGMTGLSMAYELTPYFSNITIVDENKIFQGVTASTTAKITYQHGYIYHDLIKQQGEERAKEYYQFNLNGMKRIEEIIKTEQIDCDYQKVDSFLMALFDDEIINLDKEIGAYEVLGIKGVITNIEQNISTLKAIKVTDQAHFNPGKYLTAITDNLLSKNVKIYEDTRIVNTYSDVENMAITSNNYSIIAKHIIICSHYPIYKKFNFYFTKIMPKMSYAVAGIPNVKIKNANFINTTDPVISLRYMYHNDQELICVSGVSHSASKFKKIEDRINILKEYGRTHLGITEYPFVWCTQDYTSVDYVPLVGAVNDNIFIATAFNKWGMAAAIASSLVIKDLIQKNSSEFEELLDPKRSFLNKQFLKYNLNMVPTFIKTRMIKKNHILNLEPGTGKVMRINGKKVGVYKDYESKIHLVNPICPHMYCGLRFNNLEKTYDCKCHGSRFNYDGKLIDGPSLKDLEKFEIDTIIKDDQN